MKEESRGLRESIKGQELMRIMKGKVRGENFFLIYILRRSRSIIKEWYASVSFARKMVIT